MPFFIRRILKSPIILIILFLLSIKPYNWYCASSGSCSGFSFSSLIPHKKGTTKINLQFTTRNPYKEIIFKLAPHQQSEINIIPGVQYTIRYYVKNKSQNTIIFRPKLHTNPKWIIDYLDREQCLCHQEYELASGEERILEAQFRIDADIEEAEEMFEGNAPLFNIRYDIR